MSQTNSFTSIKLILNTHGTELKLTCLTPNDLSLYRLVRQQVQDRSSPVTTIFWKKPYILLAEFQN